MEFNPPPAGRVVTTGQPQPKKNVHTTEAQVPQWPPMQLVLMGQILPQLPQLFPSLLKSAQPPLHGDRPTEHSQVPALQTDPAAQVLLHVPQLLASVCRSTQFPLHSC